MSGDRARVSQRVIGFPAHPQLVQQHRQLTGHRRNRSLLGVLASSFGQLQTPAAQITVAPERTENVVGSLDQQGSQAAVAFFADVQLRLTLAGVAASGA